MKSRPVRWVRRLSLLLVTLLAPGVASCALVLPVKKPESRPSAAAVPTAPAATPEAKAAPAEAKPAAPSPSAATKPAPPVAVPAGGSEAAPTPPSPPGAAAVPLELTPQNAVILALENNAELVIQRLKPDIVRTREVEALAPFDPLLSGRIGYERVSGEMLRGIGVQNNFITDTIVNRAGIETFFPTGTTIGADVTTRIADRALTRQLVGSRLGLTVTQALLRGFGPEVNLVAVRQAKLDTMASEYALRGFTLSLVADVERAYWQHVLCERQVEVLQESLAQAEGMVRVAEERVKSGTAPQGELAPGQAEAALRRQELIDAQSDRAKTLVRVCSLLDLPGADSWNREIRFTEKPAIREGQIDGVESHVQLALRMRPEINEAQLGLQKGDLEIVKTRNGLLPKMDVFLTLGKTGYAESYGNSWRNIGGDSHDVLAGLAAAYPAGNHEARARYQRAVLTRRVAEQAIKNLQHLVQEDVRTAYLEVLRAKEQVTAAAVTRKFNEDKLRFEMEKYQMARATPFQVARAQRDLMKSRMDEVEAAVDYQRALVELYRLDGSLLERRGISAPGWGPVGADAAGGGRPPGSAGRPQ
jgi:outer membrane protein TolC